MNSSNSIIAPAVASVASVGSVVSNSSAKTKKSDKKDKGYEVSRRMEGGIVVSRIDGKKVE
jgi:uncharacterized membrane protein